MILQNTLFTQNLDGLPSLNDAPETLSYLQTLNTHQLAEGWIESHH